MKHLRIVNLIFILLIALTTMIDAQKESVILYNSQAVKVELSPEGQINSFICAVPDYMTGFELIPTSPDLSLQTFEVAETTPIAQNAGYSVISTDRILLNYKEDFATLDRTIIDQLNSIAAKMIADPGTKLLLTVHVDSNSKRSVILNENRLASAVTYLRLKGVSNTRIQTESIDGNELEHSIAVNYLN